MMVLLDHSYIHLSHGKILNIMACLNCDVHD